MNQEGDTTVNQVAHDIRTIFKKVIAGELNNYSKLHNVLANAEVGLVIMENSHTGTIHIQDQNDKIFVITIQESNGPMKRG